MNTDEDEQTFAETVMENMNLANIYHPVNESPKLFLRRDKRVFARSVTVDEAERDVWLQYTFDIDGCVLELKNLNGIRMPIRHITLFPNDNASLREIKSTLKKHVNLTEYSKSELMNFSNSLGFQLFYERGWECWIAMIPVHKKGSVAFPKQIIRQQTFNTFLALRTRFKNILANYAMNGIASRTLMKNDIIDVRKMFVLPDDCSTILSAVQTALNDISLTGFRPIIFCYRFGEKMTDGLPLSDFNREEICRSTIHAAVDISTDGEVDLFWSTSGLQELIGQRGVLSTCLSLTDCGNFQSNLDGRLLDIKQPLRMICRFPDKLMFVQLYSDLPHRQPRSRFHPISGCIVGGMCFPRPTADAFLRDAQHYVSTLQSNWMLMKRSTCRMEFVVSQGLLSDTLDAKHFIDVLHLENLLENTPLLVPFPPQTLSCIRHLGLWICKELNTLLDQFQKTGDVCATWQSYQLELASEKLLWGRPLCHKSIPYSVNLGPGCLGTSRSLTDQLGFLALEPFSSCMHTDDSIPPYEIWTTSEVTGKSIVRAAGLHDHLDASYGVIGRRLLCALLQDLHEVGKATCYSLFEDFFKEMKSCKTKFRTVGAVTVKSLVKL